MPSPIVTQKKNSMPKPPLDDTTALEDNGAEPSDRPIQPHPPSTHAHNHDAVAHFNTLANDWWDPDGPLKTLHEINPFRLQYIRTRSQLQDQTVLDVGCGGGILSEAMARYGAQVSGVDLAAKNIEAAQAHALHADLNIDYQCRAVNTLVPQHAEYFAVVTCMELLEHVPDPAQMIADCVALCQPGGDLFFSTINRTPKAFVTAILGAEYICGLIPRGTHQYRDFIKPSELTHWLREAGAEVDHLQGFHYAAFTRQHRLCDDVSINYMIHAKKPATTH